MNVKNIDKDKNQPNPTKCQENSMYYIPVPVNHVSSNASHYSFPYPWPSHSVCLVGVEPSNYCPRRPRKSSKSGKIEENDKEIIQQMSRLSVKQKRIEPSKEFIDKLSVEMTRLYENIKPLQTNIEVWMGLQKRLSELIERVISNAKLEQFGSTANGFALRNADIDLCVLVDSDKSSSEIVEDICHAIYKDKQYKNIKSLPKARIPIVKLKDSITGISCDIGVNNLLAVYNTSLLKAYSKIDERVLIIGLIVKYWGKQRELNEPYFGTLSSYCYILLVIHFCQTRAHPILPNLQKTKKQKNRMLNSYDVYFYDKLFEFPKKNTESLGVLLCLFFKYYAYEFDYKNSVISLREGGIISKESKNWTVENNTSKDKYWFCVEDPFEITHNLCRLVDRDSLFDIRGEFIRAYQLLCRSTPLSVVCSEP